jgi:hypothetical protein
MCGLRCIYTTLVSLATLLLHVQQGLLSVILLAVGLFYSSLICPIVLQQQIPRACVHQHQPVLILLLFLPVLSLTNACSVWPVLHSREHHADGKTIAGRGRKLLLLLASVFLELKLLLPVLLVMLLDCCCGMLHARISITSESLS